jgi:hypothetical protein
MVQQQGVVASNMATSSSTYVQVSATPTASLSTHYAKDAGKWRNEAPCIAGADANF